MRKSHFSDEQIVKIVRESDAEGVSETAKKYKVSENSIYIWRKKFGTMEPNQVSELKRIMQENARLKKLVAERDLEIEVMKEIAAKQATRSPAGRRISANAGREIRHRQRNQPTARLPASSAYASTSDVQVSHA
jgi:putative transposase